MISRLLVASCLFFGLLSSAWAAQGEHSTWITYPSAAPPAAMHGWYAAVEATFLRPHNFNSGPITFENAGNEFAIDDLADLDTLEGAPRLWLGHRGARWGARARYWTYRAHAAGAFEDIVSEDDFRFASAMQQLSAKTADLEVTRAFCVGHWWGDLFFGARWAEIERSAAMNVILFEADIFDPAQQGARSIASGVGLTFGWDGRRPIGGWGLAMVLNARGSVLWGDRASRVHQSYADPETILVQYQRTEDHGTMWIAELQAGLEWSGPLRYLNAEAFTHVVFEYQFWNSIDQPRAVSWQTVNDTHMVVGSLDSSVDFVGVAWAIGLRR